MGELTIRPETDADVEAISSVTEVAFRRASSSGTEARIVLALRRAGALRLSLVAWVEEKVVGHAAFSPASTTGDADWVALGPLSVHPDWQRRGIGRALVERGLETLRAGGAAGCIVLGNPHYYSRFGFAPAPALAPLAVPAEAFQLLLFAGPLPHSTLAFHPAFFEPA